MIKISHLNKSFNNQVVLNDINLEIQEGEIVVILGQSGSGKSVLLKHLIGLLRPDSGSIWIKGADITQLTEKELLNVRKDIGYLFQEGALFDSLDVYENVAFPLEEHTRLRPPEIEKKVKNMLTMVGMAATEHKYPTELSGGMKKRAALARAVILDPKILFCDEPTSGLDPIRSRDISDLLRDIARQLKTTTVVTSHDVENSLRIADRLTLIHEGRLLIAGTRKELESSNDSFVQSFFGQFARSRAQRTSVNGHK